MNTQVPMSALASVALLGSALACDSRYPPSAPAASQLNARIAAEDQERVCTDAGLKDAYGFYRTGTTGAGSYAAVGLATYDGAGNWTATQTISRGGVFTKDVTSAGQYEVSADCSGKLFSGGQEVARFALSDKGRQLFMLSVIPGETVWGVERSVLRGGCTNGSLDGTYGFYRTGTTSAGPLAAVGIATYDGAGNSTATQTISRNGTISAAPPITAPYEVSADCTGRLINALTGQEFARFVVVDRGNEIFQLSLAAGNAVTGVQRRVKRESSEE